MKRWVILCIYLIVYHPVGVDLRVSFGVQYDGLVGPEISGVDHPVVGTYIFGVVITVVVEIPPASVSDTRSCETELPSITHRQSLLL